MTEASNPNMGDPQGESGQKLDRMAAEALLERIADGEASAPDWSAFRTAAAIEPSLWQELAEAQRTHNELCAQVQAVVAAADRVEAPVEVLMTEGLTRRIRVVASWGGWAAAAAVLLAWGVGVTPGVRGKQTAGLGPMLPSTPEEAFQNYLTTGQKAGSVVGEVPTKAMVEVRPVANGQGYEVIYMRQILERRIVPELYRDGGVDDRGQRKLVPARVVPESPM
jgi:hypothetical protein